MNIERQGFNRQAIQAESEALDNLVDKHETVPKGQVKSQPQSPNYLPEKGGVFILQLSEMIKDELLNITVERNENEQRQARPKPRGVLFDFD